MQFAHIERYFEHKNVLTSANEWLKYWMNERETGKSIGKEEEDGKKTTVETNEI